MSAWPHRLADVAGRVSDVGTPPVHGSCAGSLIVHVIDRTAVGCTLDDDIDGCQGLEERHEGAPESVGSGGVAATDAGCAW